MLVIVAVTALGRDLVARVVVVVDPDLLPVVRPRVVKLGLKDDRRRIGADLRLLRALLGGGVRVDRVEDELGDLVAMFPIPDFTISWILTENQD